MIDKEYLHRINQFPLLTAEQEVELAERIKAGDEDARQTLTNSNLRLVVSIAKHYINKSSMPFEDLVQEGNLGLLKAVNRYEPDRGTRFSTCASWYIKHEIARAIEDKAKIVRQPVYMIEKLNKLKSRERELLVALQREPTEEELAVEMGVDTDTIRTWHSYLTEPISADTRIGEEDDAPTVGEMVPDSGDSPEEHILDIDKKETLDKVLCTLEPRERELIRLRYGLDDGEYRTLDETGRAMKITKERVRQIEATAFRKLRQPLRQKMIREAFA